MDIARKVFAGEPVDLTVGYFNAIWQGDANSYALRSLELCASPPAILNVTGPERISVREMARVVRLASSAARPASSNSEGPVALLSDSSRCRARLGEPDGAADGAAAMGGALGAGRRRLAEQADPLRGDGWPLLTTTVCRALRRTLLRGARHPGPSARAHRPSAGSTSAGRWR